MNNSTALQGRDGGLVAESNYARSPGRPACLELCEPRVQGELMHLTMKWGRGHLGGSVLQGHAQPPILQMGNTEA